MTPPKCVARAGLIAAFLATLLLGGCSSAGQGFALFPTGNYLLDTTKMLRDTAPPQPDLPRELNKSLLSSYLIQPGDGLLVETEALDSPVRFPGDQTVLPDGTIDLGRYGRRVVAGRTIEEIESEVQDLVRAGSDDKTVINVRLINPRSAVYYVLGEVASPGSFPIIGRETILDGILAAGGVSGRASNCNIILSRPTEPHGCRVVLPICYRHITQMADTSTNYQLMPGDRIYVATRTLCEQLAFWKQKQECAFCCGCQVSCPDGHPHLTGAGGPFAPGPHPAAGTIVPNAGGMTPNPETLPAPAPYDLPSATRRQSRMSQRQ
jgi:protein involved in polysaccharide export with SLBB domain